MLSRRNLLLATAASLALPAAAGAQTSQSDDDDLFKRLDRQFQQQFQQLDQSFEERYREIDRTFQEAYEEIDRELQRIWGVDRKLPERKVWVGYLDRNQTRVVVDYENKKLVVESVDPNIDDRAFQQRVQQFLDADSKQLDQTDTLATRTREKLDKKGITAPPQQPTAPVKKELGELVDTAQKPVVTERVIPIPRAKPKRVKRVEIPFIANSDRLSAERLRKPVIAYGSEFGVRRDLILSIIKNESSFNPRARSPIPAFGLMQLVPSSGGKDAFMFVTNRKDVQPTPEYLYRPVENVQLGSAYLHILDKRYLRKITNPISRLYCVIAAYNTGAGNVARSFVGRTNINAAVPVINSMTPDQVYNHLIEKLPYPETQKYLYKVRRDLAIYEDWRS